MKKLDLVAAISNDLCNTFNPKVSANANVDLFLYYSNKSPIYKVEMVIKRRER